MKTNRGPNCNEKPWMADSQIGEDVDALVKTESGNNGRETFARIFFEQRICGEIVYNNNRAGGQSLYGSHRRTLTYKIPRSIVSWLTVPYMDVSINSTPASPAEQWPPRRAVYAMQRQEEIWRFVVWTETISGTFTLSSRYSSIFCYTIWVWRSPSNIDRIF